MYNFLPMLCYVLYCKSKKKEFKLYSNKILFRNCYLCFIFFGLGSFNSCFLVRKPKGETKNILLFYI